MRLNLDDKYQTALIGLAIAATALFAIFFYRELFPEYKVYQNRYVALEDWRAEETGIPAAPFKKGISQIVIPREDKGPELIDRCVSCHVAMKLPHFSPTKLSRDINGNIVVDSEGIPVKVTNDDYIWAKIDARIAELTDESVLANLREVGDSAEADRRLATAAALEDMKTENIHGSEVDMTRILAAHPLLGRETFPFEFHPLEDYGCTVCHGGNGRGLVGERAHGPVVDGEYETEVHPPKPDFIETDADNDPAFARVFNDKPGHHLLFQTTPILTGSLMQAKCVQCHQSTADQFQKAVGAVDTIRTRKEQQLSAIESGLRHEEQALLGLLESKDRILREGIEATLSELRKNQNNFQLSPEELDAIVGRLNYIEEVKNNLPAGADLKAALVKRLDSDIVEIVGSEHRARQIEVIYDRDSLDAADEVIAALHKQPSEGEGKGSFYQKKQSYDYFKDSLRTVANARLPLERVANNQEVIVAMENEADHHTAQQQRGQRLFMSNACYACHRISGYSRGGVGPDLTQAGLLYPWYLKESITWPQSNLKSSTMPNFRLDHEEVEDLMTYLMSQRGENLAVSEVDRRVHMRAWDAGEKLSWEKPLVAADIQDLRSSMITFGTEGCASCHRLKGFESNTGFSVEVGDVSFETLWKERQWFRELFPEDSIGSQIVSTIERHGEEIDRRIQNDVRSNSVLEEIDAQIGHGVESYYANFKYALRAKNKHFADLLASAEDAEQRAAIRANQEAWRDRVRRVMMAYVQEYGLGREIGPRVHWSGIYRDREWLIEHFRNPGSHSAKSLMPVFPYDDTKFYALTYMLQALAKQNRDEVRQIWAVQGFNPEMAYEMHCASCHGQFLHGNGPIATWIYPVPKNLRNGTFLRSLTRSRVVDSLTHGVQGTPMPAWGESASSEVGDPVLSEAEIDLLTNWLFQGLGGEGAFQEEGEMDKWNYEPQDFIEELKREGGDQDLDLTGIDPLWLLPSGEGMWAALQPDANWKSEDVERFFDIERNPDSDVDEYRYFIKQDFYTENNLREGQRLFIANCAHCHGKEGGGNGDRAATMQEAKPRMLTNLPWLRSRDDLRLLRSIKYGIPGTPMTPWGDKTSALQRMQMVMFIRQLTAERLQRENLASALYNAFEQAVLTIDETRVLQGRYLDKIEEEYQQAKGQRESLYAEVQLGEANPEDAARLYAEELRIMNQLSQQQGIDDLLKSLTDQVQEEKDLFQDLGATLINNRARKDLIDRYLQLTLLNQGRYSSVGGRLVMEFSVEREREIDRIGRELIDVFAQAEAKQREGRKVVEGQLPSAARTEKLDEYDKAIIGFQNLQRKLISTLAQAQRAREKQLALYKTINEKIREFAPTSPLDT